MERHLPRRSRWKIMMDAEEERSGANPALRILKLFPENKIMFYRLEARIVDGTGGNPPDFSIFESSLIQIQFLLNTFISFLHL